MASGTEATYTTSGLNLIAGAQIGGESPQATYMAIGTGAGLLSAALAAGTAYTQLAVDALPAGLGSGQTLAIVYQTNVDFVTLSKAANAGDTALSINTWTPSYAFPAGSGLVNEPSASDTQLQNEVYRVAIAAGTPGAAAGETLISGYCDPVATPSGTYVEVGWFGGSSATSAANSGVLIARGVVWDQHTQNLDSMQYQLDGTI